MKSSFLSGISNAQNEELKRKQDLFKEVAEHNLNMFKNGFKSKFYDYSILEKNFIQKCTDEEIRQLAINFFIKELTNELAENTNFYFDKKLKSEIK